MPSDHPRLGFELFVALRYLRARRRQAVVSVITLISVVGVAAGVAALVVALALNAGFQKEFQARILGATSHVNLFPRGEGSISDYRALMARLREVPGVREAHATIYAQVLLGSDLREQPAVLKGIGVAQGESAARVIPKLVEGNLEGFQGSREPVIVLGVDLAQGLGVSVGERVRAMGLHGELSPLGRMPRIRTFRVIGIFRSGLWQYDANWALIPLAAAQSFSGLRADQASLIEFRIDDIFQAARMASHLRRAAGNDFASNTWIDLNRPLFSALKLERLAMFAAIGLIVLVASLNIISTLTLTVMERSRDIAIITAMGGTARTLTRVFMLQGLIIGCAGTVLGDLVGGSLAWYCQHHHLLRLDPRIYSIPFVPFQLNPLDLVLVSVVAVGISFLATLYPARAATRLNPVEAIRYE